MQSVNPPGLWMYQLWRCLKIRNASSGSGISSTITFQARDRTTSRYPCATKFRKPLISFHGYSGKAPRPVYAALKRRTSSFSMLLRNAGRICSGGLVTISTSRPSSFSSSRESSYSGRTSLFHRRLDANRYRYLAFARHGRRSQIDMPRGRRNETAHEKQQRICRQA